MADTNTNGNGITKLDTVQKGIITGIAVFTFFASTVGGYFVSKNMADYRIGEVEKRLQMDEVAIKQQEAYGHPDHERRITRLETRADSADASISEMKGKLDVCVAILERLDRQMQQDQQDKQKK